MSGRFITIEGGEGAGKTTLIRQIESELSKQGFSYILTREPGGTPLAESIRELILNARSGPMTALTELFLFEAARADHVEQVIKPALKSGKHVLCDRFTHSSLAYQGYARNLGVQTVQQLNAIATGGLEPDLVIWLKIDPNEGLKRVSNRSAKYQQDASRIDQENLTFHQTVFNAFEQIAKNEKQRFAVLDASQPPKAVFESLLKHPLWLKLLGGHK